jgi:hemoglobin
MPEFSAMPSEWTPTPADSPFAQLGGTDAVRALVKRFYDAMEANEPALTAVHRCDAPGKISAVVRERFGLFLLGWLGGPQDYVTTHGHPRLRMRHGHVPVDLKMRDAWLRCMNQALDESNLNPGVRKFLDARFADVANFLRNVPE